jgi:outer membrane protein assembly factor BamB
MTTAPQAPDSTASAPRRGVRAWIPLTIIVLAAAGITFIHRSEDTEEIIRTQRIAMSGGVAILLLLGWFVLLSRLRWQIRLGGLAFFILAVVALAMSARIDGTHTGGGQLRLAWRWSPPRGADLEEIVISPPAALAPAALPAFDSPSYLGADHVGVVRGLNLETDWAAHKPIELWRRKLGLGWSSFAIVGSRAITLEQRGDRELIVCYELATGHVLWTHTNRVRFTESMGGDGPRSTPTIAEGRVYCMGATGILDCLDLLTGRLLWSRDTLKEHNAPNLTWGKSCSPLLVDDLVVVTGGSSAAGPALLAYKRADGAPAWQAGNEKASYPTPMLVTLAGRRQILIVNATTVTGHDPGDGRVLWKYTWLNDQYPKCAQPLVLDGDRVFLSADYGYGCVMLHIAADASGSLAATEVWKARTLKSQLSNMIARDGCIFGLDDGALACIDAATGAAKWRDNRDRDQRYGHGQVLLVGDQLLVQNERGSIALVRADPSGLHERAKLQALSSKTWNLPAIAGEYLLVRNDLEAVCYRLPVRGRK